MTEPRDAGYASGDGLRETNHAGSMYVAPKASSPSHVQSYEGTSFVLGTLFGCVLSFFYVRALRKIRRKLTA